MTKKDYELIAGAIHRSGMALSGLEGNRMKKESMERMRSLIATDLSSSLAHDNPRFDPTRFLEACGL